MASLKDKKLSSYPPLCLLSGQDTDVMMVMMMVGAEGDLHGLSVLCHIAYAAPAGVNRAL